MSTTTVPSSDMDRSALEKRQDDTDTAEVLPEWMSYSAYTRNGVREYTIVYVPQTYYGPSVPLGTDVWVYGGAESPPPTASIEAPALTSDNAPIVSPTVLPSSITAAARPAAPTTPAPSLAAISSSSLSMESSLSDESTSSIASAASSAVKFYSTLSEASVRSTSLAHEFTSVVSELSMVSVASVSLFSIDSLASSAASVYSTASMESATSSVSVQSDSSVSLTSAATSAVSFYSTASAESATSTASARSVSSVASVSGTLAAASSSSIASLSAASAAPVSATASSTSSTPSLQPGPSTAPSHTLNTRSIIALAIALFFGLLFLLMILVCCLRLRARRRRGIVTRHLIPEDRTHSVRQSFFRNVGGDGRTVVQGTEFDILTPAQRAARDRMENRGSRTLGSLADLGWMWVTGNSRSGSEASRGAGGSRRASRVPPGADTVGEETPLVGASSPPYPQSPTSGTGLDSPLLPVPMVYSNLPGSSSSLGSAHASRGHSRLQSKVTLSRPDSPGEGEHESAQLLTAQRATRSPLAKLGRLSWFTRAGMFPGPNNGDNDKAGPPSPGPSSRSPVIRTATQPEMSQKQRERESINSLLEMGVSSAFPSPPPSASRPGFPGRTGTGDTRPMSTLSTQSVYHDAVSVQDGSRSGSPGPAMVSAPVPSTPPAQRRGPVPMYAQANRPLSATLPSGRKDELDTPVPSPLRRSYNGSRPYRVPPPVWRRSAPMDPGVDLAAEAPPIPAWRRSGWTIDTATAAGEPATERAAEEDPSRVDAYGRRYTFGQPTLLDAPSSRPASLATPPESVSGPSRQPHEPPSLASLRSHYNQFGVMPSRRPSSQDDLLDPSTTFDTSFEASSARRATSTPRSSVMYSSGGDDGSIGPMPTSTFGKPKSGWPGAQ